MKQPLFPKLTENAEATLLRGFAAQIQLLKKPRLSVLQEIASDIGLVVIKRQDFDDVTDGLKDIELSTAVMAGEQLEEATVLKGRLEAIRLCLGATGSTDVKLQRIAQLLKQ